MFEEKGLAPGEHGVWCGGLISWGTFRRYFINPSHHHATPSTYLHWLHKDLIAAWSNLKTLPPAVPRIVPTTLWEAMMLISVAARPESWGTQPSSNSQVSHSSTPHLALHRMWWESAGITGRPLTLSQCVSLAAQFLLCNCRGVSQLKTVINVRYVQVTPVKTQQPGLHASMTLCNKNMR